MLSSFIKHSAFLWNKACLPIFHQSLNPGPLPCDLEVLPLRGREFPPLDYKQAHVTCFNQWDFNSGEESRNSSVLEWLSLLARALSFPRRRALPWWPPLLQSELPLSRCSRPEPKLSSRPAAWRRGADLNPSWPTDPWTRRNDCSYSFQP